MHEIYLIFVFLFLRSSTINCTFAGQKRLALTQADEQPDMTKKPRTSSHSFRNLDPLVKIFLYVRCINGDCVDITGLGPRISARSNGRLQCMVCENYYFVLDGAAVAQLWFGNYNARPVPLGCRYCVEQLIEVYPDQVHDLRVRLHDLMRQQVINGTLTKRLGVDHVELMKQLVKWLNPFINQQFWDSLIKNLSNDFVHPKKVADMLPVMTAALEEAHESYVPPDYSAQKINSIFPQLHLFT